MLTVKVIGGVVPNCNGRSAIRLTNGVGEGPRAVRVGVRHQRQEGVASRAAERIGLANADPHAQCDLAQQRIAGSDAVIGVDVREAVDVEQQRGEWMSIAARRGDLDPQSFQDRRAACHAGERVCRHRPLELRALQLDGSPCLEQLLDRATQLTTKPLGVARRTRVVKHNGQTLGSSVDREVDAADGCLSLHGLRRRWQLGEGDAEKVFEAHVPRGVVQPQKGRGRGVPRPQPQQAIEDENTFAQVHGN